MRTRTRAILTTALAAAMGVAWWFSYRHFTPPAGADTGVDPTPGGVLFLAFVVILTLIVNRWWVAAALLGPLASLAVLQLTGHRVYADGNAPPLNVESIGGLVWVGLGLWLLVGIRRAVSRARKWRRGGVSQQGG